MTGNSSLEGKVAIVSGGAHGLGRAMVMALDSHGMNVFVPDINEENIAHLSAETSPRTRAERYDVSSSADVERAVERCLELFGRVDVVVNNAGPTSQTLGPEPPKRFWDVSPEAVTRFLLAHALGSFLLSKTAVPLLLEQGWGRIVTVTTSHVTMTGAGRAPYGPAKAAMEAYATVMAHDLEGSDVTVNVLIPGGSVSTYPGRGSMSGAVQLQPAVMAAPIVWLASEDSDGVSGRRIIASKWDATLPADVNLERASAPIGWPTAS